MIKPTTDELKKGCGEDVGFNAGNCRKGFLCDYCLGQLKGRLDVLEEFYNYLDYDFTPMKKMTIEEEIEKIRAVLYPDGSKAVLL